MWFSPHSFGQPPKEFIEQRTIVSEHTFERHIDFILPNLKDNECYHITSFDFDSGFVEIEIVAKTIIPNPDYDLQLADYNKKLQKWQELKARWDREGQKEKDAKAYAQYLELKERFENEKQS